jgi:hypothetical protein
MYEIKNLRPGDRVWVQYLYMGDLYEVQGPVSHVAPDPELPVPTPYDVKVGHVYLTVGGKAPAEIIKVSLVRRAAIPEPPEGSIVECDGCGSRHFRINNHSDTHWISQDTSLFYRWSELQKDEACGQLKVVYTP